MPPRNPIAPGNPGGKFSRSTLFPFLSSPAQLWSKGYLLPGVLTVVASIALLGATRSGDFQTFVVALAFYIAFVQCLIVYLLCGRRQLWWKMLAVFAVSFALMFSPLFALMALPFRIGPLMELQNSTNLIQSFIGFFFTAGLLEELYKAVPLLALAAFTIRRAQNAAGRTNPIGLNEPLDGIALGVAAAAAFALIETLGQYVPHIMGSAANVLWGELSKNVTLDVPNEEAAKAAGQAIGVLVQEAAKGVGLQLLIARLLSEIAGHMAYSGYFGYFIGLAVLRPKSAPVLILIGWVTAAAIHAAWDAFSAVSALAIIIGVLSYVFLIAAILKARRISPTRADNFATVVLPGPQPFDDPALRVVTTPQPRPAPRPAPRDMGKASPAVVGERPLTLTIANVRRPLVIGLKIEPQALGSAGAGRGRGPIAEVQSHEKGLILRNTAAQAWQVKLPSGQVRQVDSGKAVRLERGVEIDFGGIKGVVEPQ